MAKKRRTRTDHPGVKVIRRTAAGKESWVARFKDPDTDKICQFTFSANAFPSREARRVWAIRKSKAIATRRGQLAIGAPERTKTPIDRAIDEYLTVSAARLRLSTMAIYRDAIKRFREWLADNNIRLVEQLSRGKLAAYRDYLISRPRSVIVKGGTRGEYVESKQKRSPYSIWQDLRATKTLVLHWYGRELLPLLTSDAIREALKPVPTPSEPPAYLPPSDCRKLLEAALRHDAEVFTATREEHAGLTPIGTTARYQPIAPFTFFLLLSGCRLGEALGLTWQDVDLDVLDSEGRKVGEIRLQASATKTKRWRAIGLDVCPSLRSLLAAMRLQAGSSAFVFGGRAPLSKDYAESAKKRLMNVYGAPTFTWQNLRQTTGTFLTNAPGIYGGASAFLSARQLGHSVTVAEKHYLGVVRGIAREARTLEAAMQIEDLARQIVAQVSGKKVDLQHAEVIGFPR